jgi:uncharacterized coiled-coil protein SlyX
MNLLSLTEDERLTLLRLVRDELAETRYPMSLKAKRLRALADKLGAHRPAAMTSAHE